MVSVPALVCKRHLLNVAKVLSFIRFWLPLADVLRNYDAANMATASLTDTGFS